MSPETFPDLLAREAERAPHVTVPPDTWRRGRRRRRLKVAGATAAAAVLLGTGAALVPTVLDRDPVQPAGPPATSDLGLPDHLVAPPERMSDRDEDGSWSRGEVGVDLAVGTAAAAWVTPGGLPVVVDAETGEHRLLDLPGTVSADVLARSLHGSGWQPLALSPDGTRLAYGYASVDGSTRTGGITVVDLRTGGLVSVTALGSPTDPVVVQHLTWSPLGQDLAFTGQRVREWTDSSIGGGTPVAGVVDDGGRVRTVEVRPGSSAVADDSSTLFVLDDRRLTTYLDCRTAVPCAPQRAPWSPPAALLAGAALSPDRASVAVSAQLYDWAYVDVDGEETRIGGEGSPDARPREQHVLGWVDQAHLLLLRDDGRGGATVSLVPVDPQTGPSVEVGRVDAGVGVPSVAIDLVTLDRPTVARPEPDWPWSEERWVLTLVVAGLAGVLLIAGVVLLRRRRRP
jgi:hypothetical protein